MKIKKILLLYCMLLPISLFASELKNDLISVVITIYNKEHQIADVIQGILDNATLPYELILVYDACKDQSEQKVRETLKNAGNIPLLKGIKVFYTPDLNETRANNVGMKAAQGKYWILVQDDMQIEEKGWDKKLIEPMKRFNDVFAVCAKWAGSYPKMKDVIAFIQQSAYKNVFFASSNKHTFGVRDAINRGPLALDGYSMQQLNYLDEEYAPLYLDDHDLCIRAYQKLRKVCGAYFVKVKSLKPTVPRPQENKPLSNGQYFPDVVKKNRRIFWERYKDYFNRNRHDEERRMD